MLRQFNLGTSMLATSIRRRGSLWISLTVVLAILSIAAVAARVAGYPAFVPPVLNSIFDSFIEPGGTVWWMTIGGLFEGFPSSLIGYTVVVASNVALWLVVAVVCTTLWRVTHRIVRGLRR